MEKYIWMYAFHNIRTLLEKFTQLTHCAAKTQYLARRLYTQGAEPSNSPSGEAVSKRASKATKNIGSWKVCKKCYDLHIKRTDVD